MKTTSYIRLAIWFICAVLAFNKALDLINAASTFANLVGFGMVIAIAFISERTVFFLNFKNIFNFKNNRNEKTN